VLVAWGWSGREAWSLDAATTLGQVLDLCRIPEPTNTPLMPLPRRGDDQTVAPSWPGRW